MSELEDLSRRLEVAILAVERIIDIVTETKRLIEDEKNREGDSDGR